MLCNMFFIFMFYTFLLQNIMFLILIAYNKISIRNALHSKFTSFVAYSVVECFIMRDFPNLIKSIDFNPIIKKMFYFKNHV